MTMHGLKCYLLLDDLDLYSISEEVPESHQVVAGQGFEPVHLHLLCPVHLLRQDSS